MRLYLTSIQRRRNPGFRVRLEWDDEFVTTTFARQDIRRRYRRLRQLGVDSLEARWIVWELTNAGRISVRWNDGTNEATV